MPIQIVRNDITKMQVDAIVNAANTTLLGGGGVDGCIHRAAGEELLAECKALGGCETGCAKITGAGKLPCKYVIHTVGPRQIGTERKKRTLLSSCYRASLELAKEYKCESIAFPLISSGAYGYPKDKALHVAVDAITEFLTENDMMVYVVIFDMESYSIGEKLFADIEAYIDDNYVQEHSDSFDEVQRRRLYQICVEDSICSSAERIPKAMDNMAATSMPVSLDDVLEQIDESFSQMLLRKIDEKAMKDSECYKRANIDRKLFSKIRNDTQYKPSKPTVIAFAVALELSLDETKDMLEKAGFALSHSYKFDIIVEYFIQMGNYNVFEINEALFAFDQSLLGA